MPKAAVAQTGFQTGEVSPLTFGAFDNPRYKKGLETLLNFIPTLQGPAVRRPGTKYLATVKDSTNPPILVPFKFSATQNYMLEFGANYIRFYANTGQVISPTAYYQVQGFPAGNFNYFLMSTQWPFYATRSTNTPQPYEVTGLSTYNPVGANSLLEIGSPYVAADLPLLRWAQNGDTIYLVHPLYPVYKLQRQTQVNWKLTPVYFQDGPYLASNSYRSIGDNIAAQFTCTTPNSFPSIISGVSLASVSNATAGTNGQILITTSAAHGLLNGQNVFIAGVGGTTEANNFSTYAGRTSTNAIYWTVSVQSSTSFLLLGSVFTHAYTSGGNIYPSVFAPGVTSSSNGGPDIGRVFAMVVDGIRYWGTITALYDASTFQINLGGTSITSPVAIPNSDASTQWYLGEYSGVGGNGGVAPGLSFSGMGYPSTVAFHQNRLVFAGCANTPQTVDGSMVGNFETFSPSVAKTLAVQDNNAYSFTLNSEDQNPIRWMVSTAQGLVAATYAAEWSMTPSTSSEALTPTNFNAQRTSFFGGAQIAPAQIGNAVLYIQRASRKLREIAYFFAAGTFRSSDLTEISEHITLPGMAQVDVQKETQPLIWGRRTDGALTSLVYNRDDVSLSAGWARHILGGRSDAAGTPPIVLSMGFIPDPLVTFDQGWFVVQRYVNGSKIVYIEYMSKISDSSVAQEDSVQADCAATYDVPFTVSLIQKSTIAGTPTTYGNIVTTAAAHGLTTGQQVRLSGVLGLALITTDINGVVTTKSAINGLVFYVDVLTSTTFNLVDVNGVQISFQAATDYVSGGQVRRMVTTISGATWLAGETVGVLADGGIHPDVVVSPTGTITLQYPAAKVQFGYRFKSQGKLLRAEAGAADGTSIGKTRRTTRAAFQLYRTGDLSIGTSFSNLIPVELSQADQNQADTAVPLYSGMIREGLESGYDFDSQVHFEMSSMLPGTVQSITSFMEEFDL